MTARREPRTALSFLRLLGLAGLGALLLAGCESEEDARMKQLAGTYVRTYLDPSEAPDGDDGSPERHVLILDAKGGWTSEHPVPSLQQFDIPPGTGSYRVNGVTVVVRSTSSNGIGTMQYTISGDTLYPRMNSTARAGEALTGMSMGVGEKTFLLRER